MTWIETTIQVGNDLLRAVLQTTVVGGVPTLVKSEAMVLVDPSDPSQIAQVANGRLQVELGNDPTIDIGKVDQGTPNAGGASAWPVSVASLPIPANAAKETGGNLETVRNRFSPSVGSPVAVTAINATSIYTPASGKFARLKWIGISSHPGMNGPVRVQIRWASNSAVLYDWWFGASGGGVPGAFAHGVVRESPVANDTLQAFCFTAPGAGTPLLVNVDMEDF